MTDNNNTKLIPLTQGKFAIVDADDYDYLMQFKWHFNAYGYAVRNKKRIKGKPREKYTMHRVIINMHKENTHNKDYIDHINGDKLDNRIENLRYCTKKENITNVTIKKGINTTSIYKGVSIKRNKWMSRIVNNGKHYVSFHETEIDAAKEYNKKALEFFGEFAKLNVIPTNTAHL